MKAASKISRAMKMKMNNGVSGAAAWHGNNGEGEAHRRKMEEKT